MSLLDDLVKIGFTEYEAKVYSALLRKHPATGYQLSKESGVPRSMVYESLKKLHAKGAALETVEDRATLYRPQSPDVLLDSYESQHLARISNLRTGLTELYNATDDNRGWSISGRTTTLSYAAQLLRNSHTEIFLVLTDQDLDALLQDVSAACQRGVAVNTLLTGTGSIDCGRVAYHPPLESELQGLTTTLLVVADDEEVLIASTSHLHETTATITRNTDMVLIARQFVWMELFTQRIYAQIGPDLLKRLSPEDRQIFESLTGNISEEL